MALTNFPDGINTGTIQVGGGTLIKGIVLNQPTLTPAAVAAATTAEQSFAVAGVLATDIVLAVDKPTEQAGLGIAGHRVVAAGTVGITFINATAAPITPTAAEVYDIVTLSH